jgi:hypothetical protein
MTPQATNRRQGGLTLCCGRSRKFRAFTWEELETVRAGRSETACCADYWQGECLARGWWWRELKEANKNRTEQSIYFPVV